MVPRPRRGGRPKSASEPDLRVASTMRSGVPRAFLRRVVAAALREGRRPRMPVSLLLTDDAGIARLHDRFLADATPTDVMTFDLDGTAEIVVSIETAARKARLHGDRLRDEVALYVVHGILHACGHDDRDPPARMRMRQAERRVLQSLGIAIAPVDD